ncbi:MAG: MBL fold metallo-hydrolase [Candidatus Obscuribacterales bacterium]|nr:MBL fold metallo-hydrolase [Candidatus Obscuribacterales bacterium]
MLEFVQLLSAGFCLHPEVMTYRTGSLKACEFPSGFALIAHKKHGAILFDTGYSDHFHQETKTFPSSMYASMTPLHLNVKEEAKGQIKNFGASADDVRYVFVSHFHADHFSALKDFPRARIVCSRDAWKSVCNLTGLKALLKGFLPGLLPSDIEHRLLFVEDLTETKSSPLFGALGQSWDMFDDDTISIVKLPGHAVGQIGVILHYGDSPIFLVADAAWSLKAIETCTPPPVITTNFLGDTKEYLKTLTNLSSIWRSKKAIIIPSHCNFALQRASVKV